MLVDVHRACVARPRGTRLVVLSDFDGTLADIDNDPTLPRIRPDAHAALAALASGSTVSLGLVSGRPVLDLASRTSLSPEVYMAGLHGLEIVGPERRFHHRALDGAEEPAQRLADALRPIVSRVPGAMLEPKGAAVAVHVRSVARDARSPLLTRVDEIARPWLADGWRTLTGLDVCEFLPAAEWTKGDAVRWIADDVAERHGRTPWVLYFGDDLTDEDGFAVSDLSVVVGNRPSIARFRLGAPADVAALLAWLAKASTEWTS